MHEAEEEGKLPLVLLGAARGRRAGARGPPSELRWLAGRNVPWGQRAGRLGRGRHPIQGCGRADPPRWEGSRACSACRALLLRADYAAEGTMTGLTQSSSFDENMWCASAMRSEEGRVGKRWGSTGG